MKAFCSCILLLCLLFPGVADAGTVHFAIVMPAETVDRLENTREAYDGARFPLFCGIATVYREENRFVFTKMTDLPIRWIEKSLQPIEEKGSLSYYGHPPQNIPVGDWDFFTAFMLWADSRGFKAYHVSSGRKVPRELVLRFKRTCLYDSKKSPPTDCAYTNWDADALYIPFTEGEIRQIEKDNAK